MLICASAKVGVYRRVRRSGGRILAGIREGRGRRDGYVLLVGRQSGRRGARRCEYRILGGGRTDRLLGGWCS